MTLQSKKPIVNKQTFKDNVDGWTLSKMFLDRVVKTGSYPFNEMDRANMTALVARAEELFNVFKIGADVLDPKAKMPNLDLAKNLYQYNLVGRRELIHHHVPYTSYYARAFHELICIAAQVALYFDAVLMPPQTPQGSPYLQRITTYGEFNAFLKTASDGFYQASFLNDIRKFLYMLRPLDQSGLEPERLLNQFVIDDAIVEAFSIVQQAQYITEMYSTKKFKKVPAWVNSTSSTKQQ